MTLYSKPALSLADQIAHLTSKGLLVPDPARARSVLFRVGLYRFKGFLLPYKTPTGYQPGTSFADVERLIDLDDLLGLHIFKAIQTAEVGLRQGINQHMLETYGIRWYADPLLFKPDDRYFQHAGFLAKAIRDFHKMPELFVGHYRTTYEPRAYPPGWMIAETMSLGSWSKLFNALDAQADKDAIAVPFGVRASTLETWMHALSILRNTCTHQSRTYDRTFKPFRVADTPATTAALRGHSFDGRDTQALRLAPRLYALHVLTQALIPGCLWTGELKVLVGRYTPAELARLGLRPGWETQAEWA